MKAKKYNDLNMVPRKGLEPPRLAALAPEASEYLYKSTSRSTISQFLCHEKPRVTRDC